MKKISKKIGQVGEIRHLGVVLENMDDKIDTLVEGQKGLGVRMDRVESGLQEMSDEAGEFQIEMRDFKKETRANFRAVEANFKSVFEYLSRIDDELKGIRVEIADLRKLLAAKADLARLEILERRVNKLEVQLAQYKKLPEA